MDQFLFVDGQIGLQNCSFFLPFLFYYLKSFLNYGFESCLVIQVKKIMVMHLKSSNFHKMILMKLIFSSCWHMTIFIALLI